MDRNIYHGCFNSGVSTEASIVSSDRLSAILSGDYEKGVSDCCGAQPVIRIVDGKSWLECGKCYERCDVKI
jgi:hypothetical protein